MSKSKRGKDEFKVSIGSGGGTLKEVSDKVAAILLGEEKPIIIKDAVLKDGICNYGYEIMTGPNRGDVHNVKGTNLFKRDLSEALAGFNVHLAYMDDVFKHSGVEVEDIDKMKADDLTFLYTVEKFEIKGKEENEGIILTGTKRTSHGWFGIKSPKIMIDNSSSYKWYNELKAAADKAREEVELYMNGKFEKPDEEEEYPDPAQLKMNYEESGNNFDADFKSAKQ